MDPGLLHAAGDRERAQAFPAVPALRGEPLRAFLDDLAHPVHRLHVVLEGWPAEQAHLRDVRRAQARHAALAFDRLDHRRLFAADVSSRAAAQMDGGQGTRLLLSQLLQFRFQNLSTGRVFIAQVDPDLADARRPGGNQHALEEAVRVALEVPAVLEGARLALVDVHRHQPRLGLGGDQAPLAPRRKAGAAQPAQPRVLHGLGELLAAAPGREAIADQLVAAELPVFLKANVAGFFRSDLVLRNGLLD